MKIIISKSQWQEMGNKAGWMRKAQVDPPNTSLQNITVMVREVPYLFEVGHSYPDGAGNYMVEEISNSGQLLKVKYIDGRFNGETREYPTLDRARIIHNEAVRRDAKNRIKTLGFSGNKQYLALGYLAKHGMITAEVPPPDRKQFESTYKSITQDDATKYLGNGYLVVKEGSKWHLELRIRFSEPDASILSQMSFDGLKTDKAVVMNRASSYLQINNNDLIWNLFKIGFKLDSQNVEDIRKYIPEKYMGDFNTGSSV